MSFKAIHYLNIFLGASAILLQIVGIIVLFFLFFVFSSRNSKKNELLYFIQKNFLILGFFISLSATLFSLIYSEVIGFSPCQLCWLQRIFMFPQVFLFGVALWDKDKKVIRYSLPLLCVGFFIALYQNFIYYFSTGVNSCGLTGVSCTQRFVSEFGGYISIPMLSITSFFTLLTISLVLHFYKKEI